MAWFALMYLTLVGVENFIVKQYAAITMFVFLMKGQSIIVL